MAVPKKEIDFFKYYNKFLQKTKAGIRVQKDGKKIKSSTLTGYDSLHKLLIGFVANKNFHLRLRSLSGLKKREIEAEKKYWKKFYMSFTDYLYDDCDYYDNYVGCNITLLRTFFNYLNNEYTLNIGNFHKDFYSPSEEIQIITLLPEQLHFLIHDTDFENSLPNHLKATKDLFVFGCTVALRFSDIIKLTEENIEKIRDEWYLKTSSQKTNTQTSVLLPEYAIEIIKRKNPKRKTIFRKISKSQFNDNLKVLIEKANWNDPRTKTRNKRGVATVIYKNPKTKEPYRFCDLVSSHTMRRTGITTMLCSDMSENVIRKISGHAANSKEFFRYVEISKKYSDTETKKLHKLLMR